MTASGAITADVADSDEILVLLRLCQKRVVQFFGLGKEDRTSNKEIVFSMTAGFQH